MRKELSYSRYQLILLIGVFAYTYFYQAANNLFPIFGFLQPEWLCDIHDTPSRNCSIMASCGSNTTLIYHYRSAAVDLRLQCAGSFIVPVITSLQLVGFLTGSIVLGMFSDACGRKPTALLSVCGCLGASLASTFATSWLFLAAFRFICGFALGGIAVGTHVVVMETIAPEHRIFVRSVVNCWGAGRIFYGLVAMLTKDWRLTFRVIDAMCIPGILIILFIVQESPRWLAQHNKIEERKVSLRRIEHIDGGVALAAILEKSEVPKKTTSYASLLATSALRGRLFFVCSLYFIIDAVSFGVDLRTATITDNVFLNTMLFGMFIMVGKPLIYILDTYVPGFNRRQLHQVSMTTAVVSLSAMTVLMNLEFTGVKAIITVVAVICVVSLECVKDAVHLCAMELFPTATRSKSVAVSNLFGGAGGSVAPYVLYLERFWKPASMLVFTVAVAVMQWTSWCCLPETKGDELVDTLHLETLPLPVKKEGSKTDSQKLNNADVSDNNSP